MRRLPANRYGVPAAIRTAGSKRQRALPQEVPFRAEPSRYYLKPGELFLGEETAQVETLLGSCVAIAMFSPRYRVGSLCHCMLPTCRNENPCVGTCQDGPRYVDCASRRMLEWFSARGIMRSEIVVKLFGGSDMFFGEDETLRKGIGRQNVEMALKVIEQEGLLLAASDVGGQRGRKIIFKTYTGEVFMKRLHRSLSSGSR